MVLVGPLALALAFGFGLWTRRMLWNSLERMVDNIIDTII